MGNEGLNLRIVYGVEFHAFVLMPNHFHMLITVPEHDLGIAMNVFMSSVSRLANLISGRSGHVFGGPYHWSLISNARYFGHALKYVYRNPVKANLCQKVEEYPYSTLHGLLGESRLVFPVHFTRGRMELSLPAIEPIEQLNWLNHSFSKEVEELIQKGLRKKLFDSLMNRNTGRPHESLSKLL